MSLNFQIGIVYFAAVHVCYRQTECLAGSKGLFPLISGGKCKKKGKKKSHVLYNLFHIMSHMDSHQTLQNLSVCCSQKDYIQIPFERFSVCLYYVHCYFQLTRFFFQYRSFNGVTSITATQVSQL